MEMENELKKIKKKQTNERSNNRREEGSTVKNTMNFDITCRREAIVKSE